jgi:DNA-directed RNA polymerase subunit E'/Rpb7
MEHIDEEQEIIKTKKTSNQITTEDELFIDSILTRQIVLNSSILNSNFNEKEILLKKLKLEVENKCIKDGFVLPNSVEINTYSIAIIERGQLKYNVEYNCKICYPVEEIIIECVCDIKSRGGIRAFYEYTTELGEKINLIEIFIYPNEKMNDEINKIKEKDKIKVRIKGVRFELNDTKLTVIAELVF